MGEPFGRADPAPVVDTCRALLASLERAALLHREASALCDRAAAARRKARAVRAEASRRAHRLERAALRRDGLLNRPGQAWPS